MRKKVILIFLILGLALAVVGCGSKAASEKKTGITTDSSTSQLKNSKPVVVAPEVIKKNVEAATEASDKLTSTGSKLDSLDDFEVKDNSGLNN